MNGFRILFPESQREGHVLIDRHVGIQGIVLENHGDISLLGREIGAILVIDQKFAA